MRLNSAFQIDASVEQDVVLVPAPDLPGARLVSKLRLQLSTTVADIHVVLPLLHFRRNLSGHNTEVCV